MLLFPGNKTAQSEWLLWDEDSENSQPDHVRLSLRFAEEEITYSAEFYWEALCNIRRELEQNSILVHCYGGSKNIYPSGMALNMGLGAMAYRLTLEQPAKASDMVSIFDTGTDVTPTTVKDQELFFKKWLESVTKRSKA